MNNAMCSVVWGMYQDNVCVPGAKRLVSPAKAEHLLHAPGESNGRAKQKSGIRCFFGDKELFS